MTAWHIHTATLFYSLLASLPNIDLFLDVGSLDGRESFAVEARFPTIKCIAFEPNPRNINVIQKEIARRRSQIDLETIAAGNENGTTSFYQRIPTASKNYGASSTLKFAGESRDGEFATKIIEVPLRRLDCMDSISSYRGIALWIDVEGAGYSVLEGLRDIVQKVQIVHIEVETSQLYDNGKLATDVIQIMSGYGLELIGSNLDRKFRRHQGDLVFLRKHALNRTVLRRATRHAYLIEHFALQKIALKVLPPKIYRTGRNLLIQFVTS